MAGEDELFLMELNLHPNEASGLLTMGDGALLGEHGWDLGFWAVLDEGEIEDCVAAIGHRHGSPEGEGWEIERLGARGEGKAGKTEDAEAITLDKSTGYVYILGSHFGSKAGPLQPKRGFVARFRETDVGRVSEDPAMHLEVSRRSFALHRLINDALQESDLDLIPLGEQTRQALIEATIDRGEEKQKNWAVLVSENDYPINIEGAAFREGGNLLLGLRFPTTAQGRPILIELGGIQRLFDGKDALPEVAGFCDLALLRTDNGEELHLVTGNVDSRDKESVLIQDYPGGSETVATHFRCILPPGSHSGHLETEFVREFPSLPRVEGIAVTPEGRTFYVTDEDEGVHLRLTRLLAG